MAEETPVSAELSHKKILKRVLWIQGFLLVVAGLCFFYTLHALLGRRQQLIEKQQKTIDVLRQENKQSQATIKDLQRRLNGSTPGKLPQHVEPALFTSQVKPMADCIDTGNVMKNERNLKIFDFFVSVKVPPKLVSQIDSVQYEFNHPTFRKTLFQSRDPSSFYQVGYKGWGCLDSVIITFNLKEPSLGTPTMDFDMCAALDQKACRAK